MYSRLFAIVLLSLCLTAACGSKQDRVATYLSQAQEYYDAGDVTTAKLEAMNAAQIEPKNAQARTLLAKIALDERSPSEAFTHLLVSIETDPNLVEARVMIGLLYFSMRDIEETEKHAKAAMRISPNDPTVRLLNARLMLLQGNDDRAMNEVDVALELDPEYIDAILFKAALRLNSGDPNAAIVILDNSMSKLAVADTKSLRDYRLLLLRRAGRIDELEAEHLAMVRDFPDEEKYLRALVQLYVSQGSEDKAEQLVRQYVEQDPNDELRHLALAEFLSGQNRGDEAEIIVRDFLRDAPDSAKAHLGLGGFLTMEMRYDEALAEFDEVLRVAPDTDDAFEARNRMASVKIRQGKPDEARRLIEDILIERADNIDALLGRCVFRYADGDYEGVIQDARVAARKDPNLVNAHLFLARAHANLGDQFLAEGSYRRILEIEPGNAEVAVELADLLAISGNLEQAEDVIRKHAGGERGSVNAVIILIRSMLGRGDIEGAEQAVRALVENRDDPTGQAETELGRVLEAKGEIDEAIEAYRRSLALNPESVDTLQRFVSALRRTDRTTEARRYLDQRLETYPDDAYAEILLARVYLQMGDAGKSREILESVIARRPGLMLAYVGLAGTYSAASEERFAVLNRGVTANPSNANLRMVLAAEYMEAGQYQDAIDAFENSLAADPNNDLVANNLAALLLERRTDEASYTRALEIAKRFSDSTNPMFADTLGWAYYRTGDFANAVQYLEIAVASDAKFPEARYHLGMAYMAAGDSTAARQQLYEAVAPGTRSYVGLDEAKKTLTQLEQEL